MAIVRWHEQFHTRVNITPRGEVQLSLIEDTGTEVNLFHYSPEGVKDLIEKLQKAINPQIEVPNA